MLNSMVPVLNKGASMTLADLDPFFVPDPGFGINGGMTRTQQMALIQLGTPALLSQGFITGMSNVTFNGNFPGGGYRIMFAIRFSDGSQVMSNMTFSDEMVVMKNTTSNAWQFKGNGFHSLMLNTMQNQQWQTATGTQTEAGLFFSMLDAGNVFRSAAVTGPGLTGAVQFVKEASPNQEFFMLATPNNALPTMQTELLTMPDTTIATIPDNARYTFSFYSSLPPRNNPVEQRTMTFPKRCFTRTETAAGGLFPTVTPSGNMNTHTFSTMMGNMMGGMTGGIISMPFTYTTPTGLPVAVMSGSYSITSTSFTDETGRTLPLNGTSASMQMRGPTGQAPTSGTSVLDVHATDIFGRDAGTAWMFQ